MVASRVAWYQRQSRQLATAGDRAFRCSCDERRYFVETAFGPRTTNSLVLVFFVGTCARQVRLGSRVSHPKCVNGSVVPRLSAKNESGLRRRAPMLLAVRKGAFVMFPLVLASELVANLDVHETVCFVI